MRALTDAGRRLAQHAERILAMVEEAEADLSAHAAEPSGRVVVTAFPSAAVAFAPALARSLRAHPRLALLLRQSSPPEGLQLVRSGEVEVAIVDDWTGRMAADLGAGEPGDSRGADPGNGVLSLYHLLRDPLVLVVERGHPAAGPDTPVDLRALRNEPWLAAPAGEPSRQAVDRLLAAVGVAPPVPSEFEGLGTVANLVARGLGIAIMPRLAVGAYERRLVVRELPAGPGPGARYLRGRPHGERGAPVGGGHHLRAARRRPLDLRPGEPGRPGAGRPGAGRPSAGRPGAGRPGSG